MKIHLILFLITLAVSLTVRADKGNETYFFRTVNYQQGLSNSAVLSIFQDNEGLMWFGTYDGANCYDGENMEVFRSDFSEQKTLSNNIVHSIQQADSSCLWMTTQPTAFQKTLDRSLTITISEETLSFIPIRKGILGCWATDGFLIIIRFTIVL